MLKLANGQLDHAKSIIVATGAFGAPVLPQIKGQDDFDGQLLHASEYVDPAPFAGKRVVVVGAGNSAVQVDTVIFATGFKSAAPFLRDIGALDADGSPLHGKGMSTTVPRLGYVGLSGQSGFASATLRGVGRDAADVVSRLLSNTEAWQ